jgi:hypothetical protein
MPASDHTRLLRQFAVVLERLDSGSLTAAQIRDALQQLIESPHASSLSLLNIDESTLHLLLQHGVHRIPQFRELSEIAVVQMLCEDDLGFGMSNELASQAVQRFLRLRGCLEELGVKMQGDRHTEAYLFEQAF